MSVGDRVKTRRKELGLSQKALASLAKISQQALSKIEKGHTSNPRHIVAIAAALESTAEELSSGEDGATQQPMVVQERRRGPDFAQWVELYDQLEPAQREAVFQLFGKRKVATFPARPAAAIVQRRRKKMS